MADKLITVHHPGLRLEAHRQAEQAFETAMAPQGWKRGPLPPEGGAPLVDDYKFALAAAGVEYPSRASKGALAQLADEHSLSVTRGMHESSETAATE